MNVNISLTPLWISVNVLPVVDNTHMHRNLSQTFDIAPRFDFMIKNGKLFVIIFFLVLHFISLHKKKSLN